jgi:hypothetical protein
VADVTIDGPRYLDETDLAPQPASQRTRDGEHDYDGPVYVAHLDGEPVGIFREREEAEAEPGATVVRYETREVAYLHMGARMAPTTERRRSDLENFAAREAMRENDIKGGDDE